MPQVSKTTIETPVPEGTRDITGTESGEPEKTLEATAARKMTLPPSTSIQWKEGGEWKLE